MAEAPDREPDMLTRWERIVLVGGVVLALIGFATRAEAARSWAAPIPASASTVTVREGLHCKTARYGNELTRVCASVHTSSDRFGNATARAAGAVATYTVKGRPLISKKALRVRLVGDPKVTRAYPYIAHRRARRGPARVVMVAQARVLAFVRHSNGDWTEHLVESRTVRFG